jgi:hypothetical protein
MLLQNARDRILMTCRNFGAEKELKFLPHVNVIISLFFEFFAHIYNIVFEKILLDFDN